MSLPPADRKLLTHALGLSRRPDYDPRIGLPLRELARSFFLDAGEAQSALERLRGEGLVEYVTPHGDHGRLTSRGRRMASVASAGSAIQDLAGWSRHGSVVPAGTRLTLCGLSLGLYPLLLISQVFLMFLPLPLMLILLLILQGMLPVLARHLLRRRFPEVARLSPAWLAGGAILGGLVSNRLDGVTAWVNETVGGGGGLVVGAVCLVAGILLGSLREA